MAESAVSFLLEKLSSFLEGEVKLLGGVSKEVVSVKDELESMRAFLRVADAIEDEDEEIKVWVKQVREVAYDTEDILDEFLYRFEENRGHGFRGYLCKMARTIKNLKSRHRLASEMQSIKSRVAEISARQQRYGYKPKIMEQGSSSSSNAANKAWYERRNDARLLRETQLVGLDDPKEELVRLLLEDAASSVRVVAVVGMGGLGKTTLVNQVYNHSQVKERFQHRAWVTVSQSPNPCDLLREIIEKLFGGIKEPIPQEAYSSRRDDLTNILFDFLAERRYLVVIDDVWEKDAWNNLKLAFSENSLGSRIMLTTRKTDVASAATTDIFEGNIYHLKSLSLAESWNLFCARTFQGRSCPQHLVEISQNILKRCMGLPLAIVTISGVLATKDTSKVNEWEMVGRSLGAEFDEVKNMRKILLLSFNDLPYNLKYCFMYLSMFPEDWNYDRNSITELWVAEGFVQEIEKSSPEEVADAYFDELLNRSMIQFIKENPNTTNSLFKVHDLLLEIILSLSKTQNFATMADNANPRLPEKMRRLSIRSTYENFQGHHDFSRLRTLKILHSQGSTSRISISEFLKDGLRLLKVLDCYELPLDSFPECITKMYTLKYLNLYGTKVASIPRSIGRLRNLENLDLGETFVEDLPVEILQLHHLLQIRVFHSIDDDGCTLRKFNGCKVPTRIGTLTSLRTLELIRASQGRLIDLITSLENLKQLRELGIQELRAEHGPALCSLIAKLSHLQYLQMETIGEDEILEVQDVSTPPQYLQDLDMYGRLEMLPHWVSKLSSLLKLDLRWSKLQVDPLESLQALPNLVALVFHKAYDGEALCFKAGGFQMLKRFECVSLGRLRRVIVEEGAMLRLQELRLEDCKLLEEVPPGLEFLSNLKKIHFINMGDLSSSNQDSNFLRLKHVPSVFIGSYDAHGYHGDYLDT